MPSPMLSRPSLSKQFLAKLLNPKTAGRWWTNQSQTGHWIFTIPLPTQSQNWPKSPRTCGSQVGKTGLSFAIIFETVSQ